MAQDAVQVDPQHYQVELENDRVRVVRIRYGPREKSVMHEHPPGLVVFLTDANFTFTYPDGRSEHIQAEAGQFVWNAERWEHLAESLSDIGFEAIYKRRARQSQKSSEPQRGGATMKHFTRLGLSILFATLGLGLPPKTAMAQDAVQVAPQQYKVLLENDQVRVVEYQSKPGEKAGMHAHPASVAYFLSPAKFKFTSPDGKTAEAEVKAGQVIWQDPVTHTTENVGTTNAHGLLIELKK